MESGICSGTAGAVASSGEVRAKSRRATYPAAINLARLAVMLAARGAGNVVRFDEIETHLGVSDRTLYRYVRALRAAFGEGTIERRQDGLTAHFDASAWGQA